MKTTSSQLPHWVTYPERQIIDMILTEALARNLLVSVYDGEDWAVMPTDDRAHIEREIAATDTTTLKFRRSQRGADGKYEVLGSVFLVHGNGSDVIADYTDTERMRAILDRALKLAEVYSEAGA